MKRVLKMLSVYAVLIVCSSACGLLKDHKPDVKLDTAANTITIDYTELSDTVKEALKALLKIEGIELEKPASE